MEKQVLNIKYVCILAGITYQAVYAAIKHKKLKAEKVDGRWSITLGDFNDYQKNRYNRDFSTKEDGSPKFDFSLGQYSPRHFAEVAKVSVQRIYYFLQRNKLRYRKEGGAYVLQISDVNKAIELVRFGLPNEEGIALN